MRKYRTALLLMSVAVCAIATISPAALAAEAPAAAPATGPQPADEPAAGLADIVVTARRVNENLQNVPVSVTAFTGQDLINRNVQKAEDIANFTPGLAIRQGQSTPTAMTLTLRGQVQTDILATLDPSVGTYVDGIYWARAYGLNGDFLDIKSVQVLKGPQGTLFGRNTTGGALLIDSNDPDVTGNHGRGSVTYGRYNEFQATGILNAAIIPDRLAARIAVQRTTRNGYTTNIAPSTAVSAVSPTSTVVAQGPFTASPSGLKYDNRDRWQARGKVLFKPTDNLSLLFSGEYFDSNERTPAREIRLATNSYAAANKTYNVGSTASLFAGILSGGPAPTSGANALASTNLGASVLNAQAATLGANPTTTNNNETPYAAARTYTYNFAGTLDTGWGAIKLLLDARRVRTNAGIDLDGSSFGIHFTEGQQQLKQQSAELQITGRGFDRKLEFAVGAFAFHESGFDQSISITVPALNPITSHFYGLIDNDSIGMYGQATYHLTDQFSFTGGVRYSVDDKGLETRNNNYNRTAGTTTCSVIPGSTAFNAGAEIVGPVQCAVKRRDSFGGVSYTAGIEYKPTDATLLYVKTAKGFRSGGQNLRAPNTAAFIPFAPEIAYSYEAGFKGEFFDKRLRTNFAIYTTTVNNIQRSSLIATPPIPPSTIPGTATILSNAGKARFQGIEAEIAAVVFPGLQLSASGALVRPKYINFADLSGDRSFERFTGVARSQFALGADYATDVGSSAKVRFHVDYAWRGKVPTAEYNFVANPQNDLIIAATTADSLGLLGARASVEFADHFELAVFGRNITNQRKFVQNLLVAPLGYITGIRQEPSTYGVTASVKF